MSSVCPIISCLKIDPLLYAVFAIIDSNTLIYAHLLILIFKVAASNVAMCFEKILFSYFCWSPSDNFHQNTFVLNPDEWF